MTETATTYRLTVDGQACEVTADPQAPLLHVLRHELDKRGTRFGCGVGLCGACFVLIDGAAVPACDTPMWAADGKEVVTVEGLAGDAGLHPVQQAVLDEQAGQCGFCLSGMLVSAAALLEREPHPTEEQVLEALDRNLCRCGVQRRIVAAVLRAAGGRGPGAGE